MGTSYKNARFLIESRMRDAARGNPDALYDLGICYSTGASGVDIDLIEAHKFFNLAAVAGLDCAADARADALAARVEAEKQKAFAKADAEAEAAWIAAAAAKDSGIASRGSVGTKESWCISLFGGIPQESREESHLQNLAAV